MRASDPVHGVVVRWEAATSEVSQKARPRSRLSVGRSSNVSGGAEVSWLHILHTHFPPLFSLFFFEVSYKHSCKRPENLHRIYRYACECLACLSTLTKMWLEEADTHGRYLRSACPTRLKESCTCLRGMRSHTILASLGCGFNRAVPCFTSHHHEKAFGVARASSAGVVPTMYAASRG